MSSRTNKEGLPEIHITDIPVGVKIESRNYHTDGQGNLFPNDDVERAFNRRFAAATTAVRINKKGVLHFEIPELISAALQYFPQAARQSQQQVEKLIENVIGRD